MAGDTAASILAEIVSVALVFAVFLEASSCRKAFGSLDRTALGADNRPMTLLAAFSASPAASSARAVGEMTNDTLHRP